MVSRISTNAIFDRLPLNMANQQVQLQRTQDQMSAGKRILKPSDDPSGTARVLDMEYTLQKINQISYNQRTAKSTLESMEDNTAAAIDLIQNVLEATTRIGDGTLSPQDYASIAMTTLSTNEELRGIGNTTDAEGKYIFAGFATDTLPFANVGGQVVYQGDEGQRMAQVGYSRRMPVNDPGSKLFMSALSGNGTFEVSEQAGNTGTGRIGAYTIINPAALTRDQYQVTFSDVAGVRHYTVMNQTLGTPVGVPTPFVAGQAISFDGLQFSMNGNPAVGDAINVQPSKPQSIFQNLSDLAKAIQTPVVTDADRARVQNTVAGLRQNLNQALSHFADARASIGSRLSELDTLTDVFLDSQIVHTQQLADVQDLDYAEAVSRLSKQKVVLEATQLSYAQIAQKTSLFDLIR